MTTGKVLLSPFTFFNKPMHSILFNLGHHDRSIRWVLLIVLLGFLGVHRLDIITNLLPSRIVLTVEGFFIWFVKINMLNFFGMFFTELFDGPVDECLLDEMIRSILILWIQRDDRLPFA